MNARRVRHLVLAVLLTAPLLGIPPASGDDATGEILLPNPGLGRAQRCVAGTPGEQGVVGITIPVSPGTAFSLTADDASGAQDFDITFYQGPDLNPCEEGAVVTANPHENVDGDEYGIVPADSQTAVVTLHRGTAGASFTYHEEPAEPDPKRSKDIVVAVIDTGLRSSHQEFDYRSKKNVKDTRKDPHPSDQVVAWWDFTAENPDGDDFEGELLPEHGEIWYPRVTDPFDGHGHGTATASLAAGGNADPIKDRSFAPGYKLAIAKVGNAGGSVTGDITEALRWATETVDADVVNMSIGAAIPIPEVLLDFHEYARFAREHGTFVVTSNGNGFGNAALVPGDPGWAKPYGNSTNTFAVGASGHANPLGIQTGYQATTDPQVTAKFGDVSAADIACDDCYAPTSGTSFSSPLVAGMAARLLEESGGLPLEDLETLLEHSARDTQAPPSDEGYGRLDYHQMVDVAIPHAQAGSTPAPDDQTSADYVENVRGPLSATTSDGTDDRMETTGLSPGNGPGVIDVTGPWGASEGEVYTFHADAGQVVKITFEYGEPYFGDDIDLYAFEGAGPPFVAAEQAVDRSTNGARVEGDDNDEVLEFEVARAGDHSFVALGWLVGGPTSFDLAVTVDGEPVSPGAAFAGDHYLIHTYGL